MVKSKLRKYIIKLSVLISLGVCCGNIKFNNNLIYAMQEVLNQNIEEYPQWQYYKNLEDLAKLIRKESKNLEKWPSLFEKLDELLSDFNGNCMKFESIDFNFYDLYINLVDSLNDDILKCFKGFNPTEAAVDQVLSKWQKFKEDFFKLINNAKKSSIKKFKEYAVQIKEYFKKFKEFNIMVDNNPNFKTKDFKEEFYKTRIVFKDFVEILETGGVNRIYLLTPLRNINEINLTIAPDIDLIFNYFNIWNNLNKAFTTHYNKKPKDPVFFDLDTDFELFRIIEKSKKYYDIFTKAHKYILSNTEPDYLIKCAKNLSDIYEKIRECNNTNELHNILFFELDKYLKYIKELNIDLNNTNDRTAMIFLHKTEQILREINNFMNKHKIPATDPIIQYVVAPLKEWFNKYNKSTEFNSFESISVHYQNIRDEFENNEVKFKDYLKKILEINYNSHFDYCKSGLTNDQINQYLKELASIFDDIIPILTNGGSDEKIKDLYSILNVLNKRFKIAAEKNNFEDHQGFLEKLECVECVCESIYSNTLGYRMVNAFEKIYNRIKNNFEENIEVNQKIQNSINDSSNVKNYETFKIFDLLLYCLEKFVFCRNENYNIFCECLDYVINKKKIWNYVIKMQNLVDTIDNENKLHPLFITKMHRNVPYSPQGEQCANFYFRNLFNRILKINDIYKQSLEYFNTKNFKYFDLKDICQILCPTKWESISILANNYTKLQHVYDKVTSYYSQVTRILKKHSDISEASRQKLISNMKDLSEQFESFKKSPIQSCLNDLYEAFNVTKNETFELDQKTKGYFHPFTMYHFLKYDIYSKEIETNKCMKFLLDYLSLKDKQYISTQPAG